MREKLIEGFALVAAIIFAITIWALLIQFIGVDNANKAAISGGVLSMIGGMVGAFSAYFIAKMQLTKQLELQDIKDRNRILLEVRMHKAEELLDNLNRTKTAFYNLQGAWTSLLRDYLGFIKNRLDAKTDYEVLKNEAILLGLEKNRDKFIRTYNECYKYKPYFRELITGIENEHDERFKDLTIEINDVLLRFAGVDYEFLTYKELYNSIEEKIEKVNADFLDIDNLIKNQINNSEQNVVFLIKEFS
ncbi:hypothetical protein CSV61_06705 [Sporosarcina sp. P3]|uniref:hypothetical protein n=1 Tax=Sporosarcina sp. P3 TaxID=2048245 RepID=UPI000C16E6E9|nr:hypothetical protein [Sporosarcina sp. P3]PID21903.1 hypothetical protein CSV61_06705 [Sporosarcina sp. P3]